VLKLCEGGGSFFVACRCWEGGAASDCGRVLVSVASKSILADQLHVQLNDD
jgi:hypothetical protein